MSFGLAAFFMSGELSAQGMAVPGEASVSETGAARYAIPIAVPPGTAGMVPSLSLAYNSQAGNGLVGMGFALEGLAAIGRCPRTMATDGVRGSVNYDANDRFCLDGQRLIAISGTYGADGAEYRTEIESFTKVISRGTAGTGPAWFEVWTKSGQRMEFGNSADSRILAQGKAEARSWAVNKVADTKGNYYTVSYVNDAANGEAYPSRIDYTGNAAAGLAPYNSVRFFYHSNRPDTTTAYHAGSMLGSSVRLANIHTYVGATLVTDYRLAYAQSASTGRSLLDYVAICDGGGNCLPPTTISWQQGTMNYTVVNNVGGQDGNLIDYRPYIADFNGDGLSDVFWDSSAYAQYDISSGNHVLWTASGNNSFQILSNWLSQDGTTSSHLQTSCNSWSSVYEPNVADFNRDGRADIWWYNRTCGHKNNAATHYSKTKQWFSNPDGTYRIQDGPNKGNERGEDDSYYSFDLRMVEINADNRPDVIWFKDREPSELIWKTQQNGTVVESTLINNPSLGTSFWARALNSKAFRRSSQVDFNGDGKADILWLKSSVRGMNRLSFGDGESTFTQILGADSALDNYTPYFADLNGDGLTDIMWNRQDDSGRSHGDRMIWLSKGDGAFDKFANAGGLNGTLGTREYRPYLADFNGDGLSDVLWIHEDAASNRTLGPRVLWTNTGNNTFSVNSNLAGQNGALTDFVANLGDFNGDGKPDIFWDKAAPNETRSRGQRVLWQTDGIVPDLMTGATTGVGATASFTYKSLTDSAVYTRDVGAIDPVVELQGAMLVVSRLQQANGVGGQRSIAYRYAGAKGHVDGRGFLGFRQITTTDEQTGIAQTATYRQEHPFTGLVAQEVTWKDGVTLSSSTNTHEATDLGGSRSQVTLKQSVTGGMDLDSTRLPGSTTTYQYDAYGNATQIAVTTSDGFSKTTTNTYVNNTANWVLGRLQTATVTSRAPDLASQPPATGDPVPDGFDFIDVTNAPLNQEHQASTVITGFTGLLQATVTGGGATIRKNGAGQWRNSINLVAGDTLNIRMTSSPSHSSTAAATVTVGGVSADWRIVTLQDTTPDAFDFVDLVDVPLSTLREASTVVSGFTETLTTNVSGADAQVRKNNSGNWGTSVSLSPGNTLNLRMTSSGSHSTSVTAIIRIGSTSADWRITTLPPPCAGVQVGGYCWYYGASGQSCDALCSNHGGCNLAGTRDFAGSGGTLNGCTSVLNALGQSGSAGNGTGEVAFGCGRILAFGWRRITSPTTTCGASNPAVTRVCACNN
jgi:hypothetical protein